MPDLRPLEALRARLAEEMGPKQVFRAPVWGNPRPMTEALRAIKRELGGNDAEPSDANVLQATLASFGQTRSPKSFTELKYICYGITVPVGQAEWRVLDRAPLFSELLNLVDRRQDRPKQFRRCYQGLLSGYFGFNLHVPQEGAAPGNWIKLQDFLRDRLQFVLKGALQRGALPDWVLAPVQS